MSSTETLIEQSLGVQGAVGWALGIEGNRVVKIFPTRKMAREAKQDFKFPGDAVVKSRIFKISVQVEG